MNRNTVRTLLVILGVLIIFASGSRISRSSPPPRTFLWGVATSSYQVEGGIDCSDPSLPCNDYDFFNGNPTIKATVRYNTDKVGPAIDLAPAGDANKVWQPAFSRRDFSYARLLGLNSFRISLEWGRIEPQDDQWDPAAIQRYNDMLDEMRARGLTPIVTLNHFTLPQWVLQPPSDQQCRVVFCFPTDGEAGYLGSLKGWESSQTVDEYVEFVQKVVTEFKGKVDFWLTLNEPVGSQVALGYVAGVWSPGFLFDGPKAKHVLHNLIEAHARAYDAITAGDHADADGDGIPKQVGFAHAVGPTVAARESVPETQALHDAAAGNFEYFLYDYMVNAVVKGEEDLSYLDFGVRAPTPQPGWKDRLDFLGINYYRRFHVFHEAVLSMFGGGFLGGGIKNSLYGESEPHELLNDMGWAMYPQGLYDVVMKAKNQWNLPVMITENGTPERQDRNRAPHIVAHLGQLARAIADGANVIGYMHWTIADNWELQKHYHPESQFGLFHIPKDSRDNGNVNRELTEGALAYRQVIEESRALSSTGTPTQAAVDNAREKFGDMTSDGTQVRPPSRSQGRIWEGTTTESPGGGITLYLGCVKARGKVTGLVFWHSLKEWRTVDLLVDGQGPFLRESSFDDVAEAARSRDIRVSYTNGVFGLPGGSAWPIQGTGLWRWDTGDSPWGTDFFYVSKLEGQYAGKYLTFSDPGPRDVATPICVSPFCVPQPSGSMWRELKPAVSDYKMTLDGSGLAGESLFDLSLALSSPVAGMNAVATTRADKSGGFTAVKPLNPLGLLDRPFRRTGYLHSPTAEHVLWVGERDGSTVTKFEFLERRDIFTEYPVSPPLIGGKADQYVKENDPVSVMPVRDFFFDVRDSVAGVPTAARISWKAGGRLYQIPNSEPTRTIGQPFCGLVVCNGSWRDIDGLVARRLSEQFPPVVSDLPDRRIEADTADGANVRFEAPALDLDGNALSYTWTVDATTLTGANPTGFLALGSHSVCVEVSSQVGSTQRCATFTVVDTTPPTITLNEPKATSYLHSGNLTLDYSASDLASGVKQITAFMDESTTLAGHGLASGQVIDLLTELALGPHVFKVVAIDNAGNMASAFVTFTVIATAESIKDDVTRFGNSGLIKNLGLTTSLLSKLLAAADARARGNCAEAAQIYQSFINEVRAQSGTGIDPVVAAILIADGEYLMVNCP